MALILMILSPVAICCYYNAWPPLTAVLKSLLGVAPMYWTVGIIEVFTFVPMLGTGGSYLGLCDRQPDQPEGPLCAQRHGGCQSPARQRGGRGYLHHRHRFQLDRDHAGHRPGRVRAGVPAPVLESPALKPAFDNILPALFGALGVVFISKNPKLAAAPLAFMVVLFLLAPGLSSSVGVLVPVGALIAIGAARIMYKRGMLGGAPADGKEGRQ